MTANIERQKVKQRVAKLLNVTLDRGASENEALLAAEKAEELMVHYDIQLSELSMRLAQAVQKTVPFIRYGNRRKAHPAVPGRSICSMRGPCAGEQRRAGGEMGWLGRDR
jgi:Protein of unknown function (DUF2786)